MAATNCACPTERERGKLFRFMPRPYYYSCSFHPPRVLSLTDRSCAANDTNCKLELDRQDILLYFIFNQFEVTTFVHEPKFEKVSLFSYIGGYMGMWLGASLVALFDLAETLVNLLVINPLSQSSRRKTRVM
ncbi:hypothetical protein JTE90_004675 [Oedothorax gibbosus]|uniref:Uncharacterized protein n=1 Tax=Oedothorax gibbosus TaxID=931172 RepID=A0AAV6UAR6_9ARAC|nr:hypothetical protein JTE90_004675 [Oedothorax gibbosus]